MSHRLSPAVVVVAVLLLPGPALAGWSAPTKLAGTKGPAVLNQDGTAAIYVGKVKNVKVDQVLRRNLAGGPVTDLSVNDANQPGNDKSGGSANGGIAAATNLTDVAFLSKATNLTADPAALPIGAYARTAGGTTKQLSPYTGQKVNSVAMSGDGALAAWDHSRDIHVTNVATGSDTTVVTTKNVSFLLGMSADGTRLLVGTRDGSLGGVKNSANYVLVDLMAGTHQLLRTGYLAGSPNRYKAALAADGRHAVVPTSDGNGIELVDAATGIHTLLDADTGPSPFPALSADGSTVAWRHYSGDAGDTFAGMVKRAGNAPETVIPGHVGSSAISGDGRVVMWPVPVSGDNGPLEYSVFSP